MHAQRVLITLSMFAYGYVQYNIGVVEFMQNTHLFIQLIWIGVYVWICVVWVYVSVLNNVFKHQI